MLIRLLVLDAHANLHAHLCPEGRDLGPDPPLDFPGYGLLKGKIFGTSPSLPGLKLNPPWSEAGPPWKIF